MLGLPPSQYPGHFAAPSAPPAGLPSASSSEYDFSGASGGGGFGGGGGGGKAGPLEWQLSETMMNQPWSSVLRQLNRKA